jgi:hypothetical protein
MGLFPSGHTKQLKLQVCAVHSIAFMRMLFGTQGKRQRSRMSVYSNLQETDRQRGRSEG